MNKTVRAADDRCFTIIVLPDTQYYTEVQWKTDQYFRAQTQWIVDNRQKEHIVFVSQVGDLQQDGTYLRVDDHQFDETIKDRVKATHENPNNPPQNDVQWQRASTCMKILDDADIPLCAVAGNHDYEHWDKRVWPVKYLAYFGPQRYWGRKWFGGYSPGGKVSPPGMNMYQFFEAGGHKFLSIGLQFAPGEEDFVWAQKILDENPAMPTIISTHDYQNRNGRDPNGRTIWNGLVKNNPQIFMVLSGHVNGAHQQVSKDDAGQPVYELLSDYQDYECSKKTGYNQDYAHGGGFLRIMRFDPGKNQVDVKTFSPVIKKYMDDKENQFTLDLNFADRFSAHATTEPAAMSTK